MTIYSSNRRYPVTHPKASTLPMDYQNPFQNNITNDQTPSAMSSRDPNDPIYQNFTATGRPLAPSRIGPNSSWALSLDAAESFGRAAPNLLPVRYTDNSIISVPVLSHAEPTQSNGYTDDNASEDLNPIKEQNSKSGRSRFSLSSFRRKSTSKGKQQDFIIKEMTRGNYLKHYAKDDSGRYIGSEDPAVDCILNNEEDRVKWGRG